MKDSRDTYDKALSELLYTSISFQQDTNSKDVWEERRMNKDEDTSTDEVIGSLSAALHILGNINRIASVYQRKLGSNFKVNRTTKYYYPPLVPKSASYNSNKPHGINFSVKGSVEPNPDTVTLPPGMLAYCVDVQPKTFTILVELIQLIHHIANVSDYFEVL